MNYYVETPLLSPTNWYAVNPGELPTYLYRHMDQWLSILQTKSFEFARQYFQKWQRSDIVPHIFNATITPMQIQLYSCDGEPVPGYILVPTEKITTLVNVDFAPYEANGALDDIEDGVYFWLLTAGSDDNVQTFVSEPFEVAETWPNTMLMEYSNDKNDFDVIFKRIENGQVAYLKLNYRIEATLLDFQPGGRSTKYEDQNLDVTTLKSQTFRNWSFVLGPATGVPDYVSDKVSRIFDCSSVLLDGKGFVRPDGANLERNGIDLYGMAGYRMDIREAKNRQSKRFTGTIGELSSQLTVVYNFNTKGWGAQNGPASDNIIQIESID